MNMLSRFYGNPESTGFLLRLHIFRSHFGPGFIEEFGPGVFTFYTDLVEPLPEPGGALIFVAHKKLKEARVVSIAPTCQQDMDFGVTHHPYTVDARVVGEEVIDVPTMRYLIYKKRWEFLDLRGKINRL